MRYFLTAEKKCEIPSRQAFLYDVFKLWFVVVGEFRNFIILESFPLNSDDNICIIYGHNGSVAALLTNANASVYEKNVFIISCEKHFKEQYKQTNKTVYLSPQLNSYSLLLAGSAYNFEFDVTEAEINLYNAPVKGNLEKLQLSFKKL